MQSNATYSKATSPFDVFTISIGGYPAPIDIPLPIPAVSLSSPFTRSTVAGGVIILISLYLSAVRYLRYQHIEKIQQTYGRTPAEFSKINYKDAQAILGSIFLLDSPWIFLQAKDFAFLRVCTPRSCVSSRPIRRFSRPSVFPYLQRLRQGQEDD
jgi:hypothetical protein